MLEGLTDRLCHVIDWLVRVDDDQFFEFLVMIDERFGFPMKNLETDLHFLRSVILVLLDMFAVALLIRAPSEWIERPVKWKMALLANEPF